MKYSEKLFKSLKKIRPKIKLAGQHNRSSSKREVSRKLLKRYFRLIR